MENLQGTPYIPCQQSLKMSVCYLEKFREVSWTTRPSEQIKYRTYIGPKEM